MYQTVVALHFYSEKIAAIQLDSMLFTQDDFVSVINHAKVMYKTFVSNYFSNIMRWRDGVNKYQTIFVDLKTFLKNIDVR